MDSSEIALVARVEDKHWWYAERRRILRKMLQKHSVRGHALDVGAAGGGNTRVLISMGLQSLALEHDQTGLDLCANRGVPAIQADICDSGLTDSAFDLVVAWDVLEHIVDDKLACAEIARLLKPRGYLFCAVPVDMGLWSDHDVAVGHVRRYEKKEIAELIERSGLEIVERFYWNVLLKPAVRLRRRSSKGSDLDDPSRLVNTVMKVIISLERLGVFRKIPGVTEFVVARKPLTALSL